ncbi:hypothetical protein ACSW9O_15795 (plasmid) [Clostridium perfringens]|nr:hypothetical protein [Clostridium perfringens]
MANIYNTFEFVGAASIKKDTEKSKGYEVTSYDSGWTKERLLLNVKADDSAQLVEISDMYLNKPGYKFKKKTPKEKKPDGSLGEAKELEIAWKDRNNESVLEKVANWQKYILDFSNNKERYDLRVRIEKLEKNEMDEKELEELKIELEQQYGTADLEDLKKKLKELEDMRFEFLNKVDMIAKFKKEFPKYSNMKFKISGSIEFYESMKTHNVGKNFMVKKIEKALDKDKTGLKGDIDIYFNEDSLNEDIFEDAKKYIINGYVKTFDSQLKKDMYLPYPLIVDASRLDMNNPKHKGRIDMLISPLKDCDEDVIYELQYKVKFARGAERKEITLDDLNEWQRNAVEVGLKDFEDLKRELGGNTMGDKIDETRAIGFNLKDFPEGAIATELKLSEMLIDKELLLEEQSKNNNNNLVTSTGDDTEPQDDLEDLL